jgi:hypothetical protein
VIRKWDIRPEWQVMPHGTGVIHFAIQQGQWRIWTRDLPADLSVTDYEVRIYPTGGTPPDEAQHLGTLEDGGYVWHLFGRPCAKARSGGDQ